MHVRIVARICLTLKENMIQAVDGRRTGEHSQKIELNTERSGMEELKYLAENVSLI